MVVPHQPPLLPEYGCPSLLRREFLLLHLDFRNEGALPLLEDNVELDVRRGDLDVDKLFRRDARPRRRRHRPGR